MCLIFKVLRFADRGRGGYWEGEGCVAQTPISEKKKKIKPKNKKIEKKF